MHSVERSSGKPTVYIRCAPQDFVVEELPLYEPSGQGSHLFLRIRKTGLTTFEAVRRIGQALQVDTRDIGYAGMKDRHAVTTQTLSVPVPSSGQLELAALQGIDGLEVLEARAHGNKLRIGHLLGNRFRLVLRQVQAGQGPALAEQLQSLSHTGVPNFFGPQRFGRDSSNPDFALAWLRGSTRGPRDGRQQRLLFSAVQAMLFDRVLSARLQAGTWNTVLRGDVVKKHDTGGMFDCEDDTVDAARASRGEVSATGPIYGPKMRWPHYEPEQLERSVLRECLGSDAALDGFGRLGEGSRRVLRIMPSEVTVRAVDAPELAQATALEVSFTLPKGAYATTLLSHVCQVHDASLVQASASEGSGQLGGDETASQGPGTSE